MAAMQLPAARGVADTLFSVLPRAAELVVWDLLRVALSPILGFGGSKAEPGPDVPVMRWYQEAVLDPDSLQARAGRPVGFKGVGRNQHLNRRLYVAAGRGDAGAVRKLAAGGADVNARLFQLINYLDGSNGQPSGQSRGRLGRVRSQAPRSPQVHHLQVRPHPRRLPPRDRRLRGAAGRLVKRV